MVTPIHLQHRVSMDTQRAELLQNPRWVFRTSWFVLGAQRVTLCRNLTLLSGGGICLAHCSLLPSWCFGSSFLSILGFCVKPGASHVCLWSVSPPTPLAPFPTNGSPRALILHCCTVLVSIPATLVPPVTSQDRVSSQIPRCAAHTPTTTLRFPASVFPLAWSRLAREEVFQSVTQVGMIPFVAHR
jgi:hypothetical protein